MTVYIDDFHLPQWSGRHCHLIADSNDELHDAAVRIGIAHDWWWHGLSGPLILLPREKRQDAIDAGAVAITTKQAALMTGERRRSGHLGQPDPAYASRQA